MKRKSTAGSVKNMLPNDLLALLVLLGLVVGYINIITKSVNVPDESFYTTLAHRFFLGDRPFADEWGVEQLTGLLLLPPFSAYYALTRSTDGVILFFRAFYTVCQMLVVSYIYISLRFYANRRYRDLKEKRIFTGGALIASAVYAFSFPLCIPTLSYYTMSTMGLAVLTVTMFCYPPHWLKYVFCGVVFAVVIMAEPAAILLYFVMAILFFALKTHNRFAKKQIAPHYCDNRFFLFLNVGGYSVFFAFFAFLLYRTGLRSFARGLQNIFGGTGYVFNGSSGSFFGIQLKKAISAGEFYGAAFFVVFALLLALEVLFYKHRKKTRLFFTVALLALLVSEQVYIWIAIKDLKESSVMQMYLYYGIPLYISAPAWMLLAEKIDKSLCCGWVCCMLFSVTFSVSSRVALGWGGVAASVFSVMLAVQVLIEIKQTAKFTPPLKKGRSFQVALGFTAVLCALLVIGNVQWFRFQNKTFLVESVFCRENQAEPPELHTKIRSGPLRGIFTTKEIADVYYASLEDLDSIRENCPETKSVFINSLTPAAYLYLNRDYGTYSAWYRDTEYYRLEIYWREHPEKKPAYIYFPSYEAYTYSILPDDELAALKTELEKIVTFESQQGKAGEIYSVP